MNVVLFVRGRKVMYSPPVIFYHSIMFLNKTFLMILQTRYFSSGCQHAKKVRGLVACTEKGKWKCGQDGVYSNLITSMLDSEMNVCNLVARKRYAKVSSTGHVLLNHCYSISLQNISSSVTTEDSQNTLWNTEILFVMSLCWTMSINIMNYEKLCISNV